jgi:hypothetical protein
MIRVIFLSDRACWIRIWETLLDDHSAKFANQARRLLEQIVTRATTNMIAIINTEVFVELGDIASSTLKSLLI